MVNLFSNVKNVSKFKDDITQIITCNLQAASPSFVGQMPTIREAGEKITGRLILMTRQKKSFIDMSRTCDLCLLGRQSFCVLKRLTF